MEVDVISKSGSSTGRKITLSDEIFGIDPHSHTMWLSINAYLANQRQGTHSTRTRSMVSGSTRKLFRQKGTGRARQGGIKSPLNPGGATMHGPKPHLYTQKLPRKVKQLARKSALSEKVANNAFVVVEDMNMTAPRTRTVQEVLNALNLDSKQALFLTAGDNNTLYMSGRNIPTLTMLAADKASMYEIWKSRAVIAEESAIKIIEDSFAGLAKELPEVEHISIPS